MQDSGQLAQKTAVWYSKTGPAIYHSHHDMIRFWERAVKRADLPVRLTQGFNPHPRLVFPHALGLGIASLHEEIEIELHASVDLDQFTAGINQAIGDTLTVVKVFSLPAVKKSRQVVRTEYAISGFAPGQAAILASFVEDLGGKSEILCVRGKPGETRTVDIKPYLAGLSIDSCVGADNPSLLLAVSHTTAGSARPDEIAKLAAASVEMDWRDLVIEKTAMVLS
ncbi:MAG: TIGR03936 family radical SAM-associated protein [Planctomycetes bacterium]|nr:TIGR03936 family radical SAM-associated protein [Planctomycetota bacterium]